MTATLKVRYSYCIPSLQVRIQSQAAWLCRDCSVAYFALQLISYSQKNIVYVEFTFIVIAISLPSTPESKFKDNQPLDLFLVDYTTSYSFTNQK